MFTQKIWDSLSKAQQAAWTAKYPRLDPLTGREKLDPKPKVLFMEISEDGEVLQEGKRRPMSLKDTVERIARTSDYDPYDYDPNEDIQDYEDDPDEVPTKARVATALSQSRKVDEHVGAIKLLQKAGYAISKAPKEPTEPVSPSTG